jgi:hypothetical protein
VIGVAFRSARVIMFSVGGTADAVWPHIQFQAILPEKSRNCKGHFEQKQRFLR